MAGQDRTADLLAGRGVDLLPADGGFGAATISLDLTAPVPAGQLSLLFDLASGSPTAPRTIPPAWVPGAVDGVPPPATLIWAYADGAIDPGQVQDGTGGLRRSGIVRLPIPASWNSGAGVRTLLLSTDQATFAAPPRLQQLQANVAVARHQQEFSHSAGTDWTVRFGGWLPLPGQHLDPPDAQGRLLDASLTLRERDGQEHRGPRWPTSSSPAVRTGCSSSTGPPERCGSGTAAPGGYPSRDPGQPGDALSSATWTLGGGAAGNGGATANWRSPDPAVAATAANPVPAEGGADAETIAQARARAGAALNEVDRAVTPADHETHRSAGPRRGRGPGARRGRRPSRLSVRPGPRGRLRLRRARRAARRRRLGPAGFRAGPPARSGNAHPGLHRAGPGAAAGRGAVRP